MECYSSHIAIWTADLKAHVLSNAIEHVYSAFFYTTSMHLLYQQSEEVLFSCFVTRLNAAFESKLTLEDKGNESGSENFNIPTPLRQFSESTMFPVIPTSPWPYHSIWHRYQPVMPQTCMMLVIIYDL